MSWHWRQVHTFYGASASLRPETSFAELRATQENSGLVEENKSLYWHPTVMKHDKVNGRYHKVQMHYASAYYIWTTGKATAFPEGLQMIATAANPEADWSFECVDPSACTRDDCSVDGGDDWNFPATACAELEVRVYDPAYFS